MALAAKPSFQASSREIEQFDFVEVTASTKPMNGNPFVAASFTGDLHCGGAKPLKVNGFADAMDGSKWRIRFLALYEWPCQYRVSLRGAAEEGDFAGQFRVRSGRRKGLVQVRPLHRAHFLWSGTGEPYYWNGLTTYALMGWTDEARIRAIIDRAARLKVNRLRVTLVGPRVEDASRWYEPLKPSADFKFLFGPWVAKYPERVSNPEWDVTRFDVAYWQKYERLVAYARERDVVISVIFFLDGQDAGADPFGSRRGGGDEQRYYQYAASRLAAYSNVMWDVTNEWHLFRSAWWVEQTGTYLKSQDPYGHLISCHGRGEFPWMVSQWPDFAMFQMWDEGGGYDAMLKRRQAQAATGRIMPQVNEEYGYEDHYPVKWGGNRRPPARSADNRRRLAWQIAMAGCYQTTGERANRGDGEGPATPGGWINGGFDDSMRMLEGYARMVEFFLSFEHWRLEPVTEGVEPGTRLLAEKGRRYVLYLDGGSGGAKIDAGRYRARWYNPRTGAWTDAPDLTPSQEGVQRVNAPSAEGDWALLLEARP
jgi:hypothetical protein